MKPKVVSFKDVKKEEEKAKKNQADKVKDKPDNKVK